MGHRCGDNCKRKTGVPCLTCRINLSGGQAGMPLLGATAPSATRDRLLPPARHKHGTPQQIGTAIDMYFDGLSYRKVAGNVEKYFGRKTTPMTVFRWVQDGSRKADEIVKDMKVDTGPEWVADEVAVKVGGKQYWLFNVMDSKTRFILGAYLTEYRTARSAQTVLALARERAANPPKTVKTDGLRPYREAVPRAFPTRAVKHVVSQGIRTEINNNLPERLQGTIRDRDKTLRGLKERKAGQTYIDGLVLHYNYFRPYGGIDGKRPAEAAGMELPFENWSDIATLEEVD